MMRRRLRRIARFALPLLVVAGAWIGLRLRDPEVPPLPAADLQLCGARRPDGTLPAACAPSEVTGGNATLLLAGDTAEVDAALPVLEREGLDHPFADTVEITRGADLALANLESPITDGGEPFPLYQRYRYRAPSRSAEALARAGFDVLGLANNHVMDYGAGGLGDTVLRIAEAGMLPVGAGAGAAEARRAVIARVGGVNVGILARCERQLVWDLYLGQYA